MSDVVQGKNVNLLKKVNDEYIPIACATGCTFEFSNEWISKTTVNSGLFREKRVRISDVRGTASGVTLLKNASNKLSIFYFLQEGVRRAEGEYKFLFVDDAGEMKELTMTAIIESIPLSSSTGDLSRYELNIQGTGGFQMDPLESPDPNPDDTLNSDWWSTVEGEYTISGNSAVKAKSLVGVTVMSVWREGKEYNLVDSTPVNRQCRHHRDTGEIEFDDDIPFNDGETVFVLWLE